MHHHYGTVYSRYRVGTGITGHENVLHRDVTQQHLQGAKPGMQTNHLLSFTQDSKAKKIIDPTRIYCIFLQLTQSIHYETAILI